MNKPSRTTGSELICERCGSDQIMNDLFDDEIIYWCSHCNAIVEENDDEDDEEPEQ